MTVSLTHRYAAIAYRAAAARRAPGWFCACARILRNTGLLGLFYGSPQHCCALWFAPVLVLHRGLCRGLARCLYFAYRGCGWFSFGSPAVPARALRLHHALRSPLHACRTCCILPSRHTRLFSSPRDNTWRAADAHYRITVPVPLTRLTWFTCLLHLARRAIRSRAYARHWFWLVYSHIPLHTLRCALPAA